MKEDQEKGVIPSYASTTATRPQHHRRRFISSFIISFISLATILALYSTAIDITTTDHHSNPYERYLSSQSHSHSDFSKKWGTRFLSIPSNSSIRQTSHSFTQQTHIAGTEGDRLSALRVKHRWEELLGIKKTSEREGIYDAGTREDREALMGRKKRNCHRHRRIERWIGIVEKYRNRFNRFFFNFFVNLPFSRHHDHRHHDHHKHSHKLEQPRVWISTYYPLLNYPLSHSLSLTPQNSTSPSFVAKLSEDVLPLDSTSAKGVPTFHGFGQNGSIGTNLLVDDVRLIYASRGTREDFIKLEKEGVEVRGNVVLVQYGGSFRGLKVKAAEEAGAIGCIIYSDPIADGEVRIENGYKAYPDGPARNPSSVQRGSVQYLSIRPGDPLTPNEPAYNPSLNLTLRIPRDSKEVNVPKIPSIPISYEDAIPLLKSLNGKGVERRDREDWKEGGLRGYGVEYWTGPGEERVRFVNEVEEKVTKIWNTMALIPGQISDEIVVIGNHNDAWTFGAGDPNSGTSSMMEVVKAFGQMMPKGWKPLRTILLASWDAEEYGLIGSTEFGEDFTEYLRERVVAYLNLDVSVSGSKFELAASPSLSDLLQRSTKIVQRQQQTTTVPSLNNVSTSSSSPSWGDDVKVKTLGSGSDFTVFLQYLGVASGNLGFSGGLNDPVYHYHSNYDSFHWMETYGDPTFERHVIVSKVLGLTALSLIDDLILPLNITAYTLELERYLVQVSNLPSYPGREQLDLTLLGAKMSKLMENSRRLDREIEEIEEQLQSSHHQVDVECQRNKHHKGRRGETTKKLSKRIQRVNVKKRRFESTLLVEPGQDGLKGREWYKSLVVAPGRWLGYGATTLPGLTEALELDGDVEQAKVEIERLERCIDRATRLLSMDVDE